MPEGIVDELPALMEKLGRFAEDALPFADLTFNAM